MRALWSILLVLLIVPGWSMISPNDQLGKQAAFSLTPVTVRGADDSPHVGRLTFLRGYRLRSPDPVFGGFSSLLTDGERFTLLSDSGDIVRFRLGADGTVSERSFAELPAGPGTGWTKEDRDSESMTRDPATGRIWVGFENSNAIWRYAPGFVRGERSAIPPAMRDWPNNGGPEAMVRLRDGHFIVFAEQQEGPHGIGRAALLFAGDPTELPRRATGFLYLPPKGYEPTDVAELPDGQLILLNRRFRLGSGFTVVVTMLDPATIHRGAVVRGTEIARFAGPVLHDNYEGIAVVRNGAETRLWIVSDDNQSIFQQSLLLEFRLEAPPAAAPQPQAGVRPPLRVPASFARRASAGAP